jgi:hypothetical protein
LKAFVGVDQPVYQYHWKCMQGGGARAIMMGPFALTGATIYDAHIPWHGMLSVVGLADDQLQQVSSHFLEEREIRFAWGNILTHVVWSVECGATVVGSHCCCSSKTN